MREKSNIESTSGSRAMYAMMNNPITNAVSKLTKGCGRKMRQAKHLEQEG